MFGFYEGQLGWIGFGGVVGDDFNYVFIGQFGVQWFLFVIDFGGYCLVVYVVVDGVGEIYYGGVVWQCEDFVFGCEYIDCVGEQVDFDVVLEFVCVMGFLLNVQQGLQLLCVQVL